MLFSSSSSGPMSCLSRRISLGRRCCQLAARIITHSSTVRQDNVVEYKADCISNRSGASPAGNSNTSRTVNRICSRSDLSFQRLRKSHSLLSDSLSKLKQQTPFNNLVAVPRFTFRFWPRRVHDGRRIRLSLYVGHCVYNSSADYYCSSILTCILAERVVFTTQGANYLPWLCVGVLADCSLQLSGASHSRQADMRAFELEVISMHHLVKSPSLHLRSEDLTQFLTSLHA